MPETATAAPPEAGYTCSSCGTPFHQHGIVDEQARLAASLESREVLALGQELEANEVRLADLEKRHVAAVQREDAYDRLRLERRMEAVRANIADGKTLLEGRSAIVRPDGECECGLVWRSGAIVRFSMNANVAEAKRKAGMLAALHEELGAARMSLSVAEKQAKRARSEADKHGTVTADERIERLTARIPHIEAAVARQTAEIASLAGARASRAERR